MRLQAFGVALGICAITGTCTLYITQSTAQRVEEGQPPAVSNASPIYGVSIPSGYHDWRLISVKQQVVEASSGNCAPSWATILR
jgi:hypothetical protein